MFGIKISESSFFAAEKLAHIMANVILPHVNCHCRCLCQLML